MIEGRGGRAHEEHIRPFSVTTITLFAKKVTTRRIRRGCLTLLTEPFLQQPSHPLPTYRIHCRWLPAYTTTLRGRYAKRLFCPLLGRITILGAERGAQASGDKQQARSSMRVTVSICRNIIIIINAFKNPFVSALRRRRTAAIESNVHGETT